MAPGDPKLVPCREIAVKAAGQADLVHLRQGQKNNGRLQQDKRNRFQVYFLRTSRIAYCVKQCFRVGNQFVRRM